MSGYEKSLPVAVPEQQQPAFAATHAGVKRANQSFALEPQTRVPISTVRFDLRGCAAGLTGYQRGHSNRGVIRLNSDLLPRHPEAMLQETVPHELAHVVSRWVHGAQIKPHRPEWRAIKHAIRHRRVRRGQQGCQCRRGGRPFCHSGYRCCRGHLEWALGNQSP